MKAVCHLCLSMVAMTMETVKMTEQDLTAFVSLDMKEQIGKLLSIIVYIRLIRYHGYSRPRSKSIILSIHETLVSYQMYCQ